jgi:hypothetical protein
MSRREQMQDSVGKSSTNVYMSSQTQEVFRATPPPAHAQNT